MTTVKRIAIPELREAGGNRRLERTFHLARRWQDHTAVGSFYALDRDHTAGEIIAVGGHAIVVEGYPTADPSIRLAYKICPGEDCQQLLMEADATRAISDPPSPNLVEYFSAGETTVPTTDEKAFFMATRFMRGFDLIDLAFNTPLPDELVMLIAADVCQGLKTAFERGYLHRDFKDSSVRYDMDTRKFRIYDFGAVVSEGRVYTPGWAGQTQLEGVPQPGDPQSDIFSFGLLLHTLLRGRNIMRGMDTQQVVSALKTRGLPPAQTDDEEIKQLVAQMVARRPNRLASYGEIEERIAAIRSRQTPVDPDSILAFVQQS